MRSFVRPGQWLGLLLLCATASAQQPASGPEPENIENMFSVGLTYWRPSAGRPALRGGIPTSDPSARSLDLAETPSRATGFEITIPTGQFHRLEVSYWKQSDSGTVFARQNLFIDGARIDRGEQVNTEYEMSNFRLAWNYLTFPAPPLDARFRIKTFWELQYTRMQSVLTFPEADNQQVDPGRNIFYPGVGIGFEIVPSSNFRIESRISGMGFPNRSRYLDAQAVAVGRFFGGLELFGGYKLYHLRTSPQNELFFKSTVSGPTAGIRYVFH